MPATTCVSERRALRCATILETLPHLRVRLNPEYLVKVATRREMLARGSEDDGPHVAQSVRAGDSGDQIVVHLFVDRVELIRLVERNFHHMATMRDLNGLKLGHRLFSRNDVEPSWDAPILLWFSF
jgi:hypothetical protein